MASSKRHHYSPEFYLKQFAEPMFGRSIRVFERKTGRWDSTRRTPSGIGWDYRLYSMRDDASGEWLDNFESFLTEHVDTPAAPAMKKAAINPTCLTDHERRMVALFVGFAAARNKGLLEQVEMDMPAPPVGHDELLRLWCESTYVPVSLEAQLQMMKPSLLAAVAYSALKWQQRKRILGKQWRWYFIETTRNAPFITSDWPAAGEFDSGYSLLSFPISSQVALLASDHPEFAISHRGIENVRALNARTLWRATRFVVCHKDSFPGDDQLTAWVAMKVNP